MKNRFDFRTFTITKREILASVSLIAVLLLVGVLISSKISEYQMDKNEVYNKAVKIKDSELFQYGLDTNIGNAFVYGDLEAVDTVTYPEINGEYIYIKKVKEKYTMHTRTVTYTTGSGKTRQTHTKVERYWTWDEVDSESKKCNEVMFCGVKFDSNKLNYPSSQHIDTIKESKNIRYKYYGVGTKHTGTIFANLKNKTIPDNTEFYKDQKIEETIKRLEVKGWTIVFWICWIVLICLCVYGFYYIDNEWLE